MLVLQFPYAETLPQNFWSRRYSIALKRRKSHSQRHSAIRGSVFSEQTVETAVITVPLDEGWIQNISVVEEFYKSQFLPVYFDGGV